MLISWKFGIPVVILGRSEARYYGRGICWQGFPAHWRWDSGGTVLSSKRCEGLDGNVGQRTRLAGWGRR